MRREQRRGERGVALAIVAIAIVAIFAVIVIAVDVGRFAHTAAEVQAVADLAALAGAKSVLVTGPGTAQSGANTAALENSFDGRTFVPNDTVASLRVEEGCYTAPSAACSSSCQGAFTPTGSASCSQGEFEAVRTTATGRAVHAITAALIHSATQSDVTKQASAAIVGINAVQPTLPVVLCPQLLAQLQPNRTCVQDAVLATIAFVPTPAGNACYSSLSTVAASASEFRQLLPPECGGRTTGRPVVSIGEILEVQNGVDDVFLRTLKSCVSGGIHDFVIPVVQCGNCTQSREVVDFVTLRIDQPSQVVDSGPAANKGVHNATQVCNNIPPGSSGNINTGLFATRQVVLVQ